ncbi:MAG: DNA/RNA nuclease SfsA [Deltaproteobacteria bacterium]|nr:MAG: DNA/RNA nuclease SfsA [Deltaproteobacteria bacterium]
MHETPLRWPFQRPLVPGRLVRRYKRFLADVVLDDGRELTAHCPSPGAMTGLDRPGSRVWLAHHDDPRRKLPWSWVLATDGDVLVSFDGTSSNGFVADAIRAGAMPPLSGYAEVRREVRIDDGSRVDLHLSGHPADPRPCWVEVKTATLGGDDGVARFPDAVTARGLKHLEALAARVRAGDRAVILYLAKRADARALAPAEEVDPAYASGLRAAVDAGVEALAWRADVTTEAITLAAQIPVTLRSP